MMFKFKAKNYGPFAANLNHLLNHLDGSYLQSEKRIPDAKPNDIIAFNDEKKGKLLSSFSKKEWSTQRHSTERQI